MRTEREGARAGRVCQPKHHQAVFETAQPGVDVFSKDEYEGGGDVKEQDCGEEQHQGEAEPIVKAMEQRAGIFGKGECVGGGGEV